MHLSIASCETGEKSVAANLSKICFKQEDIELFSAASHDRNPIHLSEEYARRTFYGQPVVFGVLGILACLGKIDRQSPSSLSRIDAEFKHPIFVGIEYEIKIIQRNHATLRASLSDGSRTLLKLDVTFGDERPREASWGDLGSSARLIPADPSEKELANGAVVTGEYQPDPVAFTDLMRRLDVDELQLGRVQLATLLWSSYVIGMEYPGRRALFCTLSLKFARPLGCQQAPFSYLARTTSLNVLNTLGSDLQFFAAGELAAEGQSSSVLMPARATRSANAVRPFLVPTDCFKGKVALVIGASRGLGAMLTSALAMQACTVWGNFNRSASEAELLRGSLADASGEVILAQGNAASLEWCAALECRIRREYGRLDILICNACPPLLPLQLESAMVARVNSYLADAMALASIPMSVFMGLVEESAGWNVVISSSFVESTPKAWPHYVAVKCAIEGLARVAARQYPKAHCLLVRPPQLDTDLTNSPVIQNAVMPAEFAAAAIVQRLQRAPERELEVLSLQMG